MTSISTSPPPPAASTRIYHQMLWWNAQWRLDVDVANVTAAYAGVNIAGPIRARC